MATVHDLLASKGKQGAVEAGFDRSVVEVAAAYLSDEDSGLGFAYSGWAQCALPHKRLPNDAAWGIAAEKVKLMVPPPSGPQVKVIDFGTARAAGATMTRPGRGPGDEETEMEDTSQDRDAGESPGDGGCDGKVSPNPGRPHRASAPPPPPPASSAPVLGS